MIESIFIFLFIIAGVATFAWALKGIGLKDDTPTFIKVKDGVFNLNKVIAIHVDDYSQGRPTVKFVLENGEHIWNYCKTLQEVRSYLTKIAQLTGAIDVDELVKLDELETEENKEVQNATS